MPPAKWKEPKRPGFEFCLASHQLNNRARCINFLKLSFLISSAKWDEFPSVHRAVGRIQREYLIAPRSSIQSRISKSGPCHSGIKPRKPRPASTHCPLPIAHLLPCLLGFSVKPSPTPCHQEQHGNRCSQPHVSCDRTEMLRHLPQVT